MKFTAEQIAQYIDGVVEGDPAVTVRSVARIEEGHEGALSFLSNMSYEKYIYDTESSVVIVNKDFKPSSPVKTTMVRVDNAYEAFASLLTLYAQSKPRKTGVHPRAVVEESATIGKDAYIGPMAY